MNKQEAQKLMAKDPDYFKKLASKGGSKLGVKKGFALLSREEVVRLATKGGKARSGKTK